MWCKRHFYLPVFVNKDCRSKHTFFLLFLGILRILHSQIFWAKWVKEQSNLCFSYSCPKLQHLLRWSLALGAPQVWRYFQVRQQNSTDPKRYFFFVCLFFLIHGSQCWKSTHRIRIFHVSSQGNPWSSFQRNRSMLLP